MRKTTGTTILLLTRYSHLCTFTDINAPSSGKRAPTEDFIEVRVRSKRVFQFFRSALSVKKHNMRGMILNL